jgi:hypothetical protein
VTRVENMKRVHQSRISEPENNGAQSSEITEPSAPQARGLTGFFDPPDQPLEGPPAQKSYPSCAYSPHADPLMSVAEEVDTRRTEDLRWGLTKDQLFAKKSGNNRLTAFEIRNTQDGISVMVAAQSREFAKEMFESIWGRNYDVAITETGTRTINPGFAEAYSRTWRAQLVQERRNWELSEESRRCRARRSEESQERIRRENFERELEWTYEEQDRLWLAEERKVAERKAAERKKAAARRRKLAKTRDRYSYDNGYDDGDGDRYDRGYDDGDGDRYGHGCDDGYGVGDDD